MDKRIAELRKSITENLPKEAIEIINKLKALKALGKTDKEIEIVIHQMNLPLKYHLFILANYSRLVNN